MQTASRRTVLQMALAGAGFWMAGPLRANAANDGENSTSIAFGLCTYEWGKNWDLATLLKNCAAAGVRGVELRTEHAHKVEPSLNADERKRVRAQFEESKIELVGLGSNERFDDPDPVKLQGAIERTKAFIELSHDVGSAGVKVKPDRFHEGIPHEKTMEQIGKALNELGEFAAGFGQQVRLEVHGTCGDLATIKAIMEIATDPNVAVCWNSNPGELAGKGLSHHFGLVKNRLGRTCHVRELDDAKYPFQDLLKLLVEAQYDGWVLLESATVPADPVAALTRQQKLFNEMIRKAGG